jgi:DNA (cytosine-5)-methyltransferase 1
MPSPTHSDGGDPNLFPFSTVNHTLSQIPDDAPNHDPTSLMFPSNKCLRPWDGNDILPRAMTTSGGQNYHPSGQRDFTLREYAALQGFPPNHVFEGSYIKKQIGNAVPPVVAKVLFESIKKQLDKADGILLGKETIVID